MTLDGLEYYAHDEVAQKETYPVADGVLESLINYLRANADDIGDALDMHTVDVDNAIDVLVKEASLNEE